MEKMYKKLLSSLLPENENEKCKKKRCKVKKRSDPMEHFMGTKSHDGNQPTTWPSC